MLLRAHEIIQVVDLMSCFYFAGKKGKIFDPCYYLVFVGIFGGLPEEEATVMLKSTYKKISGSSIVSSCGCWENSTRRETFISRCYPLKKTLHEILLN